MARIRKRDNGTYQAEVYAGRDAGGKRLYRYVTTDLERDCKNAARKLEQEIKEGRLTDLDNMRVVVWIEKYMEINKNKYAPGTRGLYKAYLNTYYAPYFKQMKLKQVNEIIIKKLQNDLLDNQANSSVRRIMGTLKKILKEALGDYSPARNVPLPKANKSCAKAPTTEEFGMIHASVAGTKYEIPVLLSGWCGFRREEIFALRPDDFDFEKNTIRIDEAYAKNDRGAFEFGPTKSNNGLRTKRAPKLLMDMLKTIVPTSKAKVVNIKKNNDPVFVHLGRPDTFSSRYGELFKRKKRADVPDYRFQDLRHYHATWLHENGYPDSYAAAAMGQTPDVFRNIYQHLRPDMQFELDKNIDSLENDIIKKTAK